MSTLIGGPNIVVDGLVLYLDAGNIKSYISGSTTWNDISRLGNNGTLINGPTFDTGNGGSIVFDRVNDYVEVPQLSTDWSQNLTVAVWIKNIGGDYRGVINTGYNTSGNWEMRFGRENFFGGVNDGTRFGCSVVTSNGIRTVNLNGELNKIGYYVMTYDGSSLKGYINGKFFTSTSQIGNIVNNRVIRIGQDGRNLEWWNSNIYIASVYNKTLSAQEILQNFNATKGRFQL